MNPPSEDFKDMLAAESGISLTFGTDLFIGREPALPDNCVTIFDTMGSKPDLTLDQLSLYNPSIQIRVRNLSYVTGWALIQSLADALHARAQETWNSTLYSVIYTASGPAMLHWDDNNRVVFIINFNIQRR